jgi:hypothetical protein
VRPEGAEMEGRWRKKDERFMSKMAGEAGGGAA